MARRATRSDRSAALGVIIQLLGVRRPGAALAKRALTWFARVINPTWAKRRKVGALQGEASARNCFHEFLS
jgi:hypothetical protein